MHDARGISTSAAGAELVFVRQPSNEVATHQSAESQLSGPSINGDALPTRLSLTHTSFAVISLNSRS
jgi:hypothetical protein